MNIPIAYAVGSCAMAALAEGLFMGRSGKQFLDSLKQPPFAPPLWAWSVIGVVYYFICGLVMYRLTAQTQPNLWAISLLAAVLISNSFWNYIYFRRRDLRLAFWYSIAYAFLIVALCLVLIPIDHVAAAAFALYAAYLPYALGLMYRTWKLNV